MKIKKVVGGILITALALSNVGLAFAATEVMTVETRPVSIYQEEPSSLPANPNITEAQAEKLIKGYIKKYFEIDVDQWSGEVQTRVEFREDWNVRGSYVWSMSYHKYNRDESLSIDVAISDKTGKIISMNRYDYKYNQEGQVAKYTKDDAKVIAVNFLKRVNADLLGSISIDPTEDPYYYDIYYTNGIRPTEYRFNFGRVENGIFVSGNGINIGVNSATGQINNYSYNWTEEALPDKNNIVSEEAAKSTLKEQVDLKLMYIPVVGNGKYYTPAQKPTEVKLVYVPNFEAGNMIDAKTGEIINYYGKTIDTLKKIDVTETQKAEFKTLTDKPARQKELTKEEATALGQELLNKMFDEKVTITRTNYYSSQQYYYEFNGRKVWQLSFRVGENQYEGNISIDALTEEVMNFYNYNYFRYEMMMVEGEKPSNNITQEAAYNKAIDILKEFYPGKMKSIKTEFVLNDIQYPSPEHYFYFQRMENDIIYQNNILSISIDAQTGRLISVNYRWDDIQLPKSTPQLSKDQATSKYVDAQNVKLQYQTIYPNSNDAKPEIKLIYNIMPKELGSQYIDANDGSYLDHNGTPVKVKKEKQADTRELLKNHANAKELTIMYESDVIDLDSYKLTDSITKNEAIKMMVLARGYYSYAGVEVGKLNFTDVKEDDPYYQYIQAAVVNRMIENKAEAFNGDKILTREEMAAIVINTTYLNPVAQAKNIYALPVQDVNNINPDFIGHVALAYGLDIIKASGDSFLPKESITLAEAAVAIYRIMELMGNRLYY